jgi:poly-gamma-glutamate capsule biosynthesis protein CapA/YwtB (metallophosphatase superfamily)
MASDVLEVMLGGDVMTGRGIDQILAFPAGPELFEEYIRDARDYVALAEQKHGAIPRSVPFDYPWGDALADLRGADVRIVNLETSVTSSGEAWPGKGINYRMAPRNVGCLTAAGLDLVSLANNHVLDWGRQGLVETLETLQRAHVRTAGAGRNLEEAEDVAVCAARGGRRVLLLAVSEPGSGVPFSWEATAGVPGVVVLRALDDDAASAVARRAERVRRSGDVVIVSIHWGTNWGYEVEPAYVQFAHALIEHGVDVVFGHSSHHPRPIEIHRGKPIFYGCGDLLNDYEGIARYRAWRQDLVLLYRLRFGHERSDIELQLRPLMIRKMRLEHASEADAGWLMEALGGCSRPFGTEIFKRADGWFGARRLRARGDG